MFSDHLKKTQIIMSKEKESKLVECDGLSESEITSRKNNVHNDLILRAEKLEDILMEQKRAIAVVFSFPETEGIKKKKPSDLTEFITLQIDKLSDAISSNNINILMHEVPKIERSILGYRVLKKVIITLAQKEKSELRNDIEIKVCSDARDKVVKISNLERNILELKKIAESRSASKREVIKSINIQSDLILSSDNIILSIIDYKKDNITALYEDYQNI